MSAIRAVWTVAWRTLTGVDVALGILLFAALSLAFGRRADPLALGVALGAAVVPDLDFLPFFVLRKRLRYSSHRRIGHHPLLVIPGVGLAGAGMAAWLRPGGELFFGLLAAAAVTAHLLHDAVHPIGLHWLSPWSWRHYRLSGGRLREVPPDEVEAFYAAKARERAGREGWADQLVSRSHRARPAEMALFGLALLALAALLL
jgi:membrane-bound metal-dependent hydrolase YbcI (DUF457 family)